MNQQHRRQRPLPSRCLPAVAFLLSLALFFGVAAVFGQQTFVQAATFSSDAHQTGGFVAQGQSVEDLMVIGNDAHVAGTVENLVVVNGSVYLAATANVQSVVDLGGQVVRESGANVQNVFTLTFSRSLLNSTVLGGALFAFLLGMRVSLSAMLIVVPLVLSLLFRPWLDVPVSLLQRSIRRMGGIGLLGTIGAVAVCLGFTATVIGIPLAALAAVLYLCLGLLGLTHVYVFIGKSLGEAFAVRPRVWLQALMGGTLVVAFANLPLVGWLLMACVWVAGAGTAVTWLWSLRRRRHLRQVGNERT